MSGIRRTPADLAFSKCVRARANWTCERCGQPHERNSYGLHCSHHLRRGNWSVRFEPLNAEALCYGCHSLTGGSQSRLQESLTGQEINILLERARDLEAGRITRRTKGKGEIAKHYRDEFARLEEKRDLGDTRRIEFTAWL